MEPIVLLITITILLITSSALGYACYNLLRKVEIYEEWTNRFKLEIDSVCKELKVVDDKNLFEKDDDVGFVFSELNRVMT
jgi:hypothetical protein